MVVALELAPRSEFDYRGRRRPVAQRHVADTRPCRNLQWGDLRCDDGRTDGLRAACGYFASTLHEHAATRAAVAEDTAR
jgi:hypothetical protein